MVTQLILFSASFVVSLTFVPIIIKICKRRDIYDKPDERKIHKGEIARFGGLAMFLGFIGPFVYIIATSNFKFNIYIYTAALLLIFLTGFVDDIINIPARYKLLLQIISAILVVYSGLYVNDIPFFGGIQITNYWLCAPFTVFWILVFINAVNLIDGLDGLASGVVFISLVFLYILAISKGATSTGDLIVALGGGIMGFYIFNYPPAKIFMGDGGAYFLGFMYATISLMGIKKTSALTVFIIPLILFLVPLVDILFVITKRMKMGYHIFTADKNHLHHRLLNLGISYKSILFIIYSYVVILGFSSILMNMIEPVEAYILFMILFCVILLSAFLLKTIEDVIFKRDKRIKELMKK